MDSARSADLGYLRGSTIETAAERIYDSFWGVQHLGGEMIIFVVGPNTYRPEHLLLERLAAREVDTETE